MTSFIRNKLVYIPFLSGLTLGTLVLVIADSLRFLDRPDLVVLTQTVMVLVLGFIIGFTLKNRLKHPFFTSTSALFYTYALSSVTIIATNIHYGLYVLITGFIAVGIFYLADKFFNRLKLHIAIKLPIAIIGFVALFAACSMLGLYLLRLTYTLFYQ